MLKGMTHSGFGNALMTRILALVLGCVLWAGQAFALEPFTISDIRVDGLQRISEGTVFNYLPLDPGDLLTASNTRSSIRELYQTAPGAVEYS